MSLGTRGRQVARPPRAVVCVTSWAITWPSHTSREVAACDICLQVSRGCFAAQTRIHRQYRRYLYVS